MINIRCGICERIIVIGYGCRHCKEKAICVQCMSQRETDGLCKLCYVKFKILGLI